MKSVPTGATFCLCQITFCLSQITVSKIFNHLFCACGPSCGQVVAIGYEFTNWQELVKDTSDIQRKIIKKSFQVSSVSSFGFQTVIMSAKYPIMASNKAAEMLELSESPTMVAQ